MAEQLAVTSALPLTKPPRKLYTELYVLRPMRISALFSLAGVFLLLPGFASAQTNAVQDQLRNRLIASGQPTAIEVQGTRLHARTTLLAFYDRRVYAPAWVSPSGALPQAEALLSVLNEAHTEGLNAANYHTAAIQQTLAAIEAEPSPSPTQLTNADLLLTDAFLLYAAHMVGGQVNPETFEPLWVATRREADVGLLLDQAIQNNTVAQTLAGLRPSHAGYAHLRDALAHYRNLQAEGGWARIPDGPTLRVGDSDARVQLLAQRLQYTGDLTTANTDSFTVALEQGIKRFQTRHGLQSDGAVGPATLAALNMPVEQRINQIIWNLERWRWSPADFGERYLLVNVAGFYLEVVERGETTLAMDVIVGQPYRRTPVFSDRMTYLVLSPYWHVPHSIASKDKLPLIKKDVGYLAKMGYSVFQGWGPNAQIADPTALDWASLSASNFPYRLRQDPGPQNALGKVKFMFPNKFNVYLHDTPQRELFSRAERSFSSGCIRLSQPLELAAHLLRDQPRWTPERIAQAASQKQETVVQFTQPMPVHLQYWTAWSTPSGEIHFRRDIYERDVRLAKALAPFQQAN